MGSEFDPDFIQKPDQRPNPDIFEAESIPIIDLSPLLTSPIIAGDDTLPIRILVAEIKAACSEVGFLQVINHGVPIELLERVQSAAKEFFALPTEEKRRVRRDDENFLGYYDMENTKNVRDWKEVFDFAVNDPMIVPTSSEGKETRVQEIWNRWPEYPKDMRASLKVNGCTIEGYISR
ncbi:codeine O-demethylase-like isoform X2 [Asparagus officinalis]|uniref:codeine O-demethylase-like isoform X2 n=1 Tax=Asparagus officinalis TaxID=4686 RepID=UPI00098DE36C|nr:codeine O-demethylase-like isoform X2 [Asparagus officinalis]